MPVRPFKYSFNAGEIAPEFEGRADLDRYAAGAKELLNWITDPLGGLRRRPGLRFVAEAKTGTAPCCLYRFEFSVEQAYVLEFGHLYIRFYQNGARIESPPGTPVEVASPYTTAQVFDLQTAQSADTMWIVHPEHAPRKLLRFSDTSWSLQVIPFDPPPSVEDDVIVGETLSYPSTTGSGITFTAGAAIFQDATVGQTITLIPSQASSARAVITALGAPSPSATAVVNILSPFPATSPLAPGTWKLSGTLGSGLRLDTITGSGYGQGAKGTVLKALLVQRDISATELISNGNFGSAFTGWDNRSADAIVTGTHTGGNNSADLQDTTKHFPAYGVTAGFRVINTTDGSNGNITAIKPGGNAVAVTLAGGAENDFDTGDSYQIFGNGGAVAANGGAQLSSGPGGIGWIEQDVATVVGQTYRVLFDVYDGPMAAQVGSSSKSADVAAEASYPIGLDRELIFTAVSATSWIQFRNNQPTMAKVTDVSVKNISAMGWTNPDHNKFIKVDSGVLEILSLDNAHSANVLVRTPLATVHATNTRTLYEAVPGAWTLEVPAWSPTRGYPRAISFQQQRLGFAGTTRQPSTVWQSAIRSYEDFGASSLADSSLEQEFATNQMNTIEWMEPYGALLVGTAIGEHLLRGVNGPLTPTNGEQLPQTMVGSDRLRPIRTHNALLLLQRGARQIKELGIDENGQGVQMVDHTLLASHITDSGIGQWAMQTKPSAILWARRIDGVMVGLTYEQFEQVRGWHRHTTGGLLDTIESVCVVPINHPTSKYTEEVYVSVRRVIGVTQKRYVERLSPGLQVDSGLSYSGGATATLGGLSHLEGRTVKVIDWANGKAAVLADRVVSGGSITLERPVTRADVGLSYASRVVTLRPELPTREGSLQGKKQRWVKVGVRVLNTSALTINGKHAIFRIPEDDMDEGILPRSGDAVVTNLGWDTDGYLTIEQDAPLDATILGVWGELEWEEG
jgi:hypothetical protein